MMEGEKQMEGSVEEAGEAGGVGGQEEGPSTLGGALLRMGPAPPTVSLRPSLCPERPPAALIYGWARPGDLGRITNDGSMPLQKK